MNIREFFTPVAIAANWNEVNSNSIPYLGQALFPSKKKAGLDLAWFKGNHGLPVSLMPSVFDAKATFRDRIGFEKLETEMPFFREGFKIKEKDRQELLRVGESNDPYAQTMINNVFDDAKQLIEAARVVPERMRMQLLFPANGNMKITIAANDVNYDYNYDPAGAWKASNYTALSAGDLWTAATSADPFAQVDAVKNQILQATGTEIDTLVMNSYTFGLLCKLDAVKSRFLTLNGSAIGYLTGADVKRVIGDTLGVRIAVYDKQYKDEAKVAHKFVPDGYVALIPAGTIGSTWFGTTPEEADLSGKSTAEVAIVDTGVAITRIIEEHPVNINTFASEIVLPSYERMDEVALMKVV